MDVNIIKLICKWSVWMHQFSLSTVCVSHQTTHRTHITHTCMHINTCTYMHIHMCTHTNICTHHVHTQKHTHVYTRMHTYKWTHTQYGHTAQLISKLTLAYAEHVCILRFLLCHTHLKRVWHATGHTRAIFRALHVSDIRVLHANGETARESHFVCCMRVILLVCCTQVIVELIRWFTG